jgi:hypothetical protein
MVLYLELRLGKTRRFDMFTRVFLILVAFFTASSAFAMRSIQADIGEDSYHIGYFSTFFGTSYGALGLSPDVIIKPAGKSIFAPGAYWYIEPEDNALFKEVAFGLRGYFADFSTDDIDQTADALAGGLIVRTQALSLNWPFHIFGSIHYAPEDTTSSDIDSLLAWSLNLEYPLLKQFFVYVGYRDIVVEAVKTNEDAHLDETAYAGIRLTF